MLSNARPREVKRLAASISPETSIASLNDFAKPIIEVISDSTKFVNVIPEIGAYSIATACHFNGIAPPVIIDLIDEYGAQLRQA